MKTSRAEPEKFCLKLPAPSGKARYSRETDSEPVPWGKGEKTPKKGSEKTLKPYAYKRSEPRQWRVTACLLHNDPTSYTFLASLSALRHGGAAKASLNRSFIARGGRRETRGSTHGQVEVSIVSTWRTEPVHVEKCLDDLWVGVKGQSNREIARTARNAFRCSVDLECHGGRATDRARGLHRLPTPDKLRIPWHVYQQWGYGC